MKNKLIRLTYTLKTRTSSVLVTQAEKGLVHFIDPRTKKVLFGLRVEKRDLDFLIKAYGNPKQETRATVTSGDTSIPMRLKWSKALREKFVARLDLEGGFFQAALVPNERDEDDPESQMDPVTGGVIIVAILVGGYLGSKALDKSGKVTVEVDVPNGKITVGVEGDGPPLLPGGDGDGGSDGDGSAPAPNPDGNTPPVD